MMAAPAVAGRREPESRDHTAAVRDAAAAAASGRCARAGTGTARPPKARRRSDAPRRCHTISEPAAMHAASAPRRLRPAPRAGARHHRSPSARLLGTVGEGLLRAAARATTDKSTAAALHAATDTAPVRPVRADARGAPMHGIVGKGLLRAAARATTDKSNAAAHAAADTAQVRAGARRCTRPAHGARRMRRRPHTRNGSRCNAVTPPLGAHTRGGCRCKGRYTATWRSRLRSNFPTMFRPR